MSVIAILLCFAIGLGGCVMALRRVRPRHHARRLPLERLLDVQGVKRAFELPSPRPSRAPQCMSRADWMSRDCLPCMLAPAPRVCRFAELAP